MKNKIIFIIIITDRIGDSGLMKLGRLSLQWRTEVTLILQCVHAEITIGSVQLIQKIQEFAMFRNLPNLWILARLVVA